MKLLFVIPEYGESIRGGIATFYNHLIPGLRRAGCTVEVCLANEQGLSTDLRQQSNVRITSIDPALVEEARARLAQFAAFPELQRVLARSFAAFRRCKNGDYDVVETTDWGLLYVPWVTVESAIPVVVQLHGSNGQVAYYDPREGRELSGLTTRLLEAALLGRADELQACSPANACDWFRLLGKDVHHIWPGWENSNLSSERCTPEVDASGRGIVVARIQKWKGPETLCQAIALLGDKAPQILWVGRDTASPRSVSAYLKRTFPSVWEKTILPIGEMSFESTAHLQATAKFAVVPSRWDTFSLSAVEAMWAKKVVICSEGAGASSLIRHGENGFRFRPETNLTNSPGYSLKWTRWYQSCAFISASKLTIRSSPNWI